jgi:hypothetical protein
MVCACWPAQRGARYKNTMRWHLKSPFRPAGHPWRPPCRTGHGEWLSRQRSPPTPPSELPHDLHRTQHGSEAPCVLSRQKPKESTGKRRPPSRCLTESRSPLSPEAQHGRRRGQAAAHGPGGAQAEPGEVRERRLDLAFGDNLKIAGQDPARAAKQRRWRSAWAQTAAAWRAGRAGVQDASAPRP